jgi:chaperonin GroES
MDAFLDPQAEVIDAFPGLMDEEGGPFIPTGPTIEDLALATGDISGFLDESTLLTLGTDVVADYKRDKTDRGDWEKIAEEALKAASQEKAAAPKAYPWPGCSNVNYPMLITAALQFNARSYPAIVKGDEAVSCKVVGRDTGKPMMGPDGLPMAQGPDGRQFPGSMVMQAPPELQQMFQPVWQVPPGGKAKRAKRVSEYMNTVLFYRMKDWESDTDSLLMQLPIVGCVFRKVWFDPYLQEQRSAMVSAMRIYVPEGARSCETTPRLTEEIPDVYPHEVREKIRSGYYREIVLDDDEERAGARMLLEQQRLIDIDGDGLEEPYIVTVDLESEKVLRIEPNFGPDDVKMTQDGRILSIAKGQFYVKYGFFPHPEGKFYDIGLGHLLKQVGAVVDTALNQLIDAGTAQTAGGGFIASGIRLQGRRGSSLQFEPGKYMTVDGVNGADLRNGIVERTLPQVSTVTFQVLDLILGAARDISGVKDVITGEASNNGQVGTTLALIEQGLQVYNAIFKRTYLSLKNEFTLLKENIRRYGGEAAAADYAEVLDDPEADFERDFSSKDMDIRPVADPSTSTRMQKAAKAQGLLSTVGIPGANPQAILMRVYESMDIENPEELMMPPPQGPDPMMVAKAEGEAAKAQKALADAGKAQAETEQTAVETQIMQAKAAYEAFAAGVQLAA